MRFIADENVDGRIVDGLRRLGHDVVWIRTDYPGRKDPLVADLARKTDRVLITFDKGFTDPAVAMVLPGVILLRFPAMQASLLAALIVKSIGTRDDWVGHTASISPWHVRMRPLR